MMKIMTLLFLVVYLFTPIPGLLFGPQPVVASAFAAAPVCESPYMVSPGESLSGIAHRCRVSLDSLLRLNPSLRNPNTIYAGQRINLTDPKPAQAAVPGTGGYAYTVRSGDTLGRIAARAGVTVSQLMVANPAILDPNRIYPGQQLRIPEAGSVPESADWRGDRIVRSIERQQNSALNYQPKRDDERWIHVDLATQTVHAYEGDQIKRSFIVSTGKKTTPTVTGTFPIWVKLRYDDMRGPGYNLKAVPYVLYFYKGYGLHGTYWHNNFGSPMSAGCVNLSVDDAAWLYDFASVGTVVNVE